MLLTEFKEQRRKDKLAEQRRDEEYIRYKIQEEDKLIKAAKALAVREIAKLTGLDENDLDASSVVQYPKIIWVEKYRPELSELELHIVSGDHHATVRVQVVFHKTTAQVWSIAVGKVFFNANNLAPSLADALIYAEEKR